MERSLLAALVTATMAFSFFLAGIGAVRVDQSTNVIVVGAGMSGISAAKTLFDAGIKDILILEATGRIGGRIMKHNFSGISVEIGANWVEGVGGSQTNPIWEMVNELNLTNYYTNWDNPSIYKQGGGGLYNETETTAVMDLADEVIEFAENISVSLAEHRLDDISILAAQRLKNYNPTTPLEMVVDYNNFDYEFAEPPRVTSLQNTKPLPTWTDFGEDSYFVADSRGYETVVQYVAKQFLNTSDSGEITDSRLIFNKVVTEIQYSSSGVTVTTEDGSVYSANYVMVSASIGVLQTNLISFVPHLPPWKILAMYQFDMGIYTKIFIKFPSIFWPTGNDTEFFLYASERRGYYPIWQQLEEEYPGAHTLLVTVTDDESRRIEQQPNSKTLEEAMEVLREMFGDDIPEATDILVPRWWSNRFYKGTFSNWPIGVSRYEYEHIRAPVGRVYFTGEHTSEKYNGYVHGAYLAGIDSTNMLLVCIQKGLCEYTPLPKAGY